MPRDLKLGNQVSIRDESFKIVGMDHYHLTNVFGNFKNWTSYTLQGKERKWLTDRIGSGFYLWHMTDMQSTKRKISSARLNFDYSGLAFIKFKEDRGFSQPRAELLFFEIGKGNNKKFFVIERFIKQNRISSYHYAGEKLDKAKIYVSRNW